jgi:hypothetical protein
VVGAFKRDERVRCTRQDHNPTSVHPAAANGNIQSQPNISPSRCHSATHHIHNHRILTVNLPARPFDPADDAPIKEKMLYASSKDAVKKKFNGIAKEIQATDFDEVGYDAIMDKMGSI